jgi:hypothetical protein
MRPPAYVRSNLLAYAPLALLLLAGCDSTSPETPEVTFKATWAGKRWDGNASAALKTDGVLQLIGSNPPGEAAMRASHVILTVEFDGPGTYHLGPGAARLDYLIGGDVISSSYTTTDQQTGTLIVEEITSTHIRGSVRFDAVSSNTDPPVGPQARFEGTYDARLSCYTTMFEPIPCDP